jgi:zinc protease
MSHINKIAYMMLFWLTVSFTTIGYAQGDKITTPWTAQGMRLVDKHGEIIAKSPNGLIVIVKESHSAPVAAVRLYVRTGSIHEEDHLGAGLSHLFEHLLAGGTTTTRSEKESKKIIQETGALFNAYTTKDHTCYYLTVPVAHVGTALNLIGDWVTRPAFPEEEFNREWGVVQRELEMNASNPSRLKYKLFDELRYKVHPAKFPVIGHQKIVQKVTRQEVLDYYKRKYTPDNCVVVVVGDFEVEKMYEAVAREFADFSRGYSVTTVLPAEPPITSPREITQIVPSLRGPSMLTVGFPSFDLLHKDLYALDTLAGVLGQSKSSILYKRLREKDELVLSVLSYNATPAYAAGSFQIHCNLPAVHIDKAKAVIWEELEKLKHNLVSEVELARTKRRLQVDHIRGHQTVEDIASAMATDFLSSGDAHFSDQYVENMQKVTPQQIREMARKYFKRNKQLTLVLTDKSISKKSDQTTTAKINLPIKKIVLKNGLRVLLKKDVTVPLVNMQLFVTGGLLSETDENNGISKMLTTVSLKGASQYSNDDIVTYFDSIGGKLSASSGNNTMHYSCEVLKENFADSLSYFSAIVLNPTVPQDQLEKVRALTLASLAQADNSWQQLASRYFKSQFFTNSPYQRSGLGLKDAIEKINIKAIHDFHQKHIVASRATLAVFGDIDIDVVAAQITKAFAKMRKGKTLDFTLVAKEAPVTQSRQFITDTKKNGATVNIGFGGMTMFNIKDRFPMEVLTEMIGSNNGWLHQELRGKGLVYYAWCFSFPGLTEGYISTTAQCEAVKVPEVVAMMQALLKKAAQGDLPEAEITLAKNNRINSIVMKTQTLSERTTIAALDELFGFGYDWSQKYSNRILAVTVEDVKRVASHYLSQKPTMTIVTSDRAVAEGVSLVSKQVAVPPEKK